MDLQELFTHPLALGREMAAKKIIKQFVHKYDLVYLGNVNQHEAADELVRGITVSASHVDSHFCVGTIKKFDLSLVERRNIVTFPERPPQKYRWVIMQIDLKRNDLPLLFIDANHHDEAFYATLFMKFTNFTYASSLFVESDPLFAKSFRVFTPADKFDETEELLSREITSMLAHHFRQFDYELSGDRLLIYSNNPVISMHMLQEMLKIGIWLATRLDDAHITTS